MFIITDFFFLVMQLRVRLLTSRGYLIQNRYSKITIAS